MGANFYHLPAFFSLLELWVQILCFHRTFLQNSRFNCTIGMKLWVETGVDAVIQAIGNLEFDNILRPGRSFETDSLSALTYRSHLCCKTCVALGVV